MMQPYLLLNVYLGTSPGLGICYTLCHSVNTAVLFLGTVLSSCKDEGTEF